MKEGTKWPRNYEFLKQQKIDCISGVLRLEFKKINVIHYTWKIKIQEPVFSVDKQKLCIVYTPICQNVMGTDCVVVFLRKQKNESD